VTSVRETVVFSELVSAIRKRWPSAVTSKVLKSVAQQASELNRVRGVPNEIESAFPSTLTARMLFRVAER